GSADPAPPTPGASGSSCAYDTSPPPFRPLFIRTRTISIFRDTMQVSSGRPVPAPGGGEAGSEVLRGAALEGRRTRRPCSPADRVGGDRNASGPLRKHRRGGRLAAGGSAPALAGPVDLLWAGGRGPTRRRAAAGAAGRVGHTAEPGDLARGVVWLPLPPRPRG